MQINLSGTCDCGDNELEELEGKLKIENYSESSSLKQIIFTGNLNTTRIEETKNEIWGIIRRYQNGEFITELDFIVKNPENLSSRIYHAVKITSKTETTQVLTGKYCGVLKSLPDKYRVSFDEKRGIFIARTNEQFEYTHRIFGPKGALELQLHEKF